MKVLAELCQPDRRQFGTVGTVEDYYTALKALVLVDSVPEDIRKQFDIARDLMLYGWFVYEFYTVASQQALACLEFGLREACQIVNRGVNPCGKRKGLRCYLEWVEKRGLIPKGKYHENISQFMAYLRNSAAHGSDTLLNYALAMPGLELVADLLNDVFSAKEVALCLRK
ncbi:hypothetical protein C4901_11110 [Acidiferrobacter sp. SPIII_3]|uniref:hypothetical protein n=1 Tax=Acidiferrobacter sp. SPIII_3 TaxID=1281578 RepID=UPI000D72DCC8|nr:hypothetical protein [Acidiferrobacter sp. SPIII_3]AWP23810.1 hypothetical protein C4901_11110 [Acidiferrobacter sp. SPIII_3]